MDNPIIVAMDGMTLKDAQMMADKLSRWVWGFKFNDLFFERGMEIGADFEQKAFMIDAKFHDIPNTVRNVTKKLAGWGAEIVTVHASGGKVMIEAAVENLPGKVAAVTVLTSLDEKACRHIYNVGPTIKVHTLAQDAMKAGASYIVCSPLELETLGGIDLPKIVPGIRPLWYQEKDDQARKMTPTEAMEAGARFLVMGRPILRADDPVEAAQRTLEEIRKG